MIRIRKAALTLIQDEGRLGYEHVGVPTSGAFDQQRYRQALDLLQISENAPAFEILGNTFEFMTSEQAAIISVVGPAQTLIDGSNCGANQVLRVGPHNWATITRTPAGDGPIYVAIEGLTVPAVLGSASFDTLSKIGPAPVAPGDEFSIAQTPDETLLGRFIVPQPGRTTQVVIRVVPGPHVTSAPWPMTATIEAVSRSGVSISVDGTLPETTGTLASLPVVPGAIQLPPSGKPIILGPDSGVTGGYPLLGVVIAADLPILARLKSGQRATLVSVDPADARSQHWKSHVTSVGDLTRY